MTFTRVTHYNAVGCDPVYIDFNVQQQDEATLYIDGLQALQYYLRTTTAVNGITHRKITAISPNYFTEMSKKFEEGMSINKRNSDDKIKQCEENHSNNKKTFYISQIISICALIILVSAVILLRLKII